LLAKHKSKLVLGVVGVAALTGVIYEVTHPAAPDRTINPAAEAASACGGSPSGYTPDPTDGVESWTKDVTSYSTGDYLGREDFTDFYLRTSTNQLVKVEEEQDSNDSHWQVQVTCPDGKHLPTQYDR
jgi:hypothetical protein